MVEKWFARVYVGGNFLAVFVGATYALCNATISVWTLGAAIGLIALAAGVVAVVERLAGD